MASGDVVKTIGEVNFDSEIGKISSFGHEAADPTKFIPCEGGEYSRTTYAKLFAKIGTAFGAGDGSTTFNVPDLRGQFLRGLDSGAGVDPGRVLGSSQEDDNKDHSHSSNDAKIKTGGYNAGGIISSLWFGGTVQSGTSSSGTESRPKNIAVKFYIRYEG